MLREIKSFPLELKPKQEVNLPLDSKILFIEKILVTWLDDGLEEKKAWRTFIWAETDPEIQRTSIREFLMVKDKESWDSRGLRYIGSIKIEEILYHFFEVMIIL